MAPTLPSYEMYRKLLGTPAPLLCKKMAVEGRFISVETSGKVINKASRVFKGTNII